MKNIKVSKKLIIGFGAVLVLTVVIGAVAFLGMTGLNDVSSEIYNENLIPVIAIGNVRENLVTVKSDFWELFHNTDDLEEVRYKMNHINEQFNEAAENFAQYEAAITDWSSKTAYIKGKEIWDGGFTDFKNTVFNFINTGDYDGGFTYFYENEADVFDTLVDLFDECLSYNSMLASESNDAANTQYILLTIVFVVILAASIVIGVGLAMYISRMISIPISDLSDFMERAGTTGDTACTPEELHKFALYKQRQDEIGKMVKNCTAFVDHIYDSSRYLEKIADGDLTMYVETLSEKDVINRSLKKMTMNLNDMFGEINTASSQVTSGSDQISDGAQSLASGATQQAATLQELSASISDISEKTQENASRTDNASKLAGSIKRNAEKGSHQMSQMMTAVDEINKANQSISKVIKVIDDIAFQTNILALNAAVEAARAGSAGKGFAVVAEEVRNLAAKSAESAKETSTLIANSMEKAQFGTQIAGETAASLDEIVQGINESNKIISEIARSSQEQSMAISQIDVGLSDVTQVVQQNSATAQESAAASQQMSGQASLLETLIAKFKLRS
jgi:methyl-accepting chemotaxis protein